MLAGLTLGDRSALEQEHLAEAGASKEKERERKKKHKKDKSKKHKKDKTRKRKEKGRSSSGSEGSDSGSEDEWLKQQQQADNSQGSPAAADNAGKGSNGLQREDWMTVPMSRSLGFDQDEKPKEDKAAEPEEAPVVAGIRYKNPEQQAAAAERAAAREAAAAAGGGRRGPVSAAAGVSWRMKAVQRAQQLAKEQGRDVNTVLSERWGSAADIAKGLINGAATAAAEGGQPSSRQHSNNRGPAAGSCDGGPAPHYLSGVRSEQAAMKRPAGLASGSKLSWRRPAAAADESRKRGRHTDRDRSRERESSRDRGRGDRGGVVARGIEDRDRDRGHDRHRDRDEGISDSGRRDGREGDHRYSADRRDRRDKSPEQRRRSSRSPDGRHQQQQQDGSERGRGDHTRAADRHGDGRDRQQGDWGRDRHQNEQRHDRRQQQQQLRRGDTDGGSGRGPSRHEQQQERQKAEVVEALKAVAGHINTYSNDGSFMQQFAQQQPQEDEQPADDSGPDSNQEQQQQQPASERPSAPPAAAAAGSNRSTAELLKARLAGKAPAAAAAAGDEAPAAAAAGGNRSVAEALRARLAGKTPAAGAAAVPASGTSSKAEVVQLPLIDASGRAMPGAFGRESAAAARRQQELAAGGRVNKRVQRYGADGQREMYFADDDNVDLQTLVKRAKHGDDALDLDRTMAGNIAARSRFKETDLDADAEYDYDAGLDL